MITTVSGKTIPNEIISLFFDPSQLSKSAILARGPLSSSFRKYYEAQLYQEITIKDLNKFNLLLSALRKRPELGALVRSLTISITEVAGGAELKELLMMTATLKKLDLKNSHPTFSHRFLGIDDNLDHSFRSLEILSLDVSKISNFTAQVTFAKLLEPIQNLSSLKELHLKSDQIVLSSTTLPSSLAAKIRSIDFTFSTSDYNPQFIAFSKELSALEELHLKVKGTAVDLENINLNPFLSNLNPDTLESISIVSKDNNMEFSRRNPNTIDHFIASCSKLKIIKIGIPILGSDLTSLPLSLEILELGNGSSVSFNSIKEFMKHWVLREDGEDEDSFVDNPLKLILSDCTAGEDPNPMSSMYSDYDEEEEEEFPMPGMNLSQQLNQDTAIAHLDRYGWIPSSWDDLSYDFLEALELIRMAEEEYEGYFDLSGSEMKEAVKVDSAYFKKLNEILESAKRKKREWKKEEASDAEEYFGGSDGAYSD